MPPHPNPITPPNVADADAANSATLDKNLELMRHFSEQYAQR